MMKTGSFIRKLLSYPLLGLAYFYKYAISPLTPASCRYTPTCSNYMIEAIKIHGPFKGTWLGLRRLSKCHPWGGHGFDPVPPLKNDKSSHEQKKCIQF